MEAVIERNLHTVQLTLVVNESDDREAAVRGWEIAEWIKRHRSVIDAVVSKVDG